MCSTIFLMRYFIFIFWARLCNVVFSLIVHLCLDKSHFVPSSHIWLVATMLGSIALEERHVDRERLCVSCLLLCPNRLAWCLEFSKCLMNKLIF